jgi:hypothetical protein
MKLKTFTLLLLPISFLVLFSFNKIDPSNPPAGRTGAPGETTCQASGCHSGGTYTGTVEITGVPDTVVANETYSITLTNSSNAVRSGFELTVLSAANTKLGTLTAGAGCSLANGGGRQYVRQSSPHTLSNGSTSWTFSWKAPDAVPGDSIYFYFASLCANGNGNDHGDNALSNVKKVVLPAFVSATGEKSPGFKLGFYPNPANDFLTVDISGSGTVKLLDESGRAVLKTKVNHSSKIDIGALQAGVYFAVVEMNGQLQTKTFIKN